MPTASGHNYTITSLQPGQQYQVTLTTSDSVTFLAFGDSGSGCGGFSGEACYVPASASGQISVTVMYTGMETDGADYTLGVKAVNNEGSLSAPKELALGSLPYSGTINANIYNYYAITGLTPGHSYYLSVPESGTSEQIYQDRFVHGFCCDFTASGTSVWVRVTGSSNGTFTLNLTDNGVPSTSYTAEGALGSEVELTLNTPHDGMTDTTASYYHIGGLVAGTEYRVGLHYNSSDNVGLLVYNQSGYGTAA
jgi:hypothetical protein